MSLIGDHAAGTEGEQGAVRLGAPWEFVWGGGSAASVDEDVTGGCDGFVEVERIFEGQVVGESGKGVGALAACSPGGEV